MFLAGNEHPVEEYLVGYGHMMRYVWRRLTANLTDEAGAALFAAEVNAVRGEGLHEVSFMPRISGMLLHCQRLPG